MGHSSIQVKVDLYGHLIPGGNKQAVDRLDTPVENPHSRGNPQPNRNLISTGTAPFLLSLSICRVFGMKKWGE